jgi:hypothetical protein
MQGFALKLFLEVIFALVEKAKVFYLRPMRLCHPQDGSTSPKYKLLCSITTKNFSNKKNALAFNRDRCCHLVLCLRLIPFHSGGSESDYHLSEAYKV